MLDFDVSAHFTDADTAFDVAADLSVADGETLVLLGPSGSGKTLLLEVLAGFHDHGGRVELDGRDVTDDPPEAREFGFVFQNYALFPHLTPRENVAFGARYHDDPRNPDELLDALGVGDLADRSVETLSGGERQAIAIARALVTDPDIVVMDEPTSALSAESTRRVQELVKTLQDEGISVIIISHNLDEVFALTNRVTVLLSGTLVGTVNSADVTKNDIVTMMVDGSMPTESAVESSATS